MGWLRTTYRLLALGALLSGCAIDTEPIAAVGADVGFGAAPDAGAEAADADAPSLTAYEGCDVDLTCTEGCADDLDCAESDEAPPDLAGLRGVETNWDAFPALALEAGEDAWFALPTGAGAMRVAAGDLAAPVSLVVYDGAHDWAMLGRSTETAAVEMEMDETMAPVLRVHAHEAVGAVVIELSR